MTTGTQRAETGDDTSLLSGGADTTARDLPVVLARGSSPDLGGDRDRALAELPDAVFLIGPLGTIEGANPRAEALAGVDRRFLLGRDIESVVSGLHAAVHAETGDGRDGHTHLIPASAGASILVEGRAVPVTVLLCSFEDGSSLVIVAVVDEASNHVLREDDVAQIVHDLRSPLATISLETEMLELADAGDLDRALLGRVVHRIVLNVSFLDRMISNLLDLCAFDAGRLALRRSRVEIRALVEQVVERAVPGRDRPRIVMRMPGSAILNVDAQRIERVVGNLLQNALKYGAKDSLVVIELDVQPSYVRVTVADRGPGIAAAQQAELFGKYRRLSGARLQEGSGLGLYVSKRIVEAHGGRIGVESIEGQGSCFYFELPR